MANSLNLESVINEIVSSPADVRGFSKEQFCKLWPEGKKVLELLAQVFPALKIVIVIIIAVGDRYCAG